MANQNVEFVAPTGLTLTAKLFAIGNDTPAYTASSVTEATNRKGIYAAAFSSVNGAKYHLIAFDGTEPVVIWEGYIEDTASTFTLGTDVLTTSEIAEAVQDAGGLSTAQAAQLAGVYSKIHGIPVVLSSTAVNLFSGNPISIYRGSEHSSSTPLGPLTFAVSNSYTVSGWTATLKIFPKYGSPTSPTISVAGSWADETLSTQRLEFTLDETETDNLDLETEYSYQVELLCGAGHPYASPSGHVIIGSVHS